MDCDLIAFDFLDKQKLTFPNPSYPSGVYDCQNPVYSYPYEERDYPVAILSDSIYDSDGYMLPKGYYLIALSDDTKFLLLIQSNIVKAKVPVATLKKIEPDKKELAERAAIVEDLKECKIKNKLKKFTEYDQELKKFDNKILRRLKASIQDTGEGYYVVKYKRFDYEASGFIKK